jgi:NAD(P)H-dependent flavin oxidoreductase YrpB (nitropropane dioxygenase family)
MKNPTLALRAQTRLPVIGAPMFLVSGPELVIADSVGIFICLLL